MASRSGGTQIKNVNKVKSGPDQAFTLPKGTSAAPIMNVKVPKTYTSSLKAVKQNIKFISGKTKKLPVKIYSPKIAGRVAAKIFKEPDMGKPQYINVSKNKAKQLKTHWKQQTKVSKKFLKQMGNVETHLHGLHAVGAKAAVKHSKSMVKAFTKAEKRTIPTKLKSLTVKLKNIWKQPK
tara:strand:- start:45 stop:581 length:537 start_codon:yes stop_codon:yes gene_type:complete